MISITRHRSSLAIGNIVGSAISNIIGAFSLGLLLHKKDGTGAPLFDKSSKIYTSLLLALVGLTAGLLGFAHHIYWQAVGGVLVGLFGVYIASIAYLIAKGWSTAPEELSDSEGDSDSDSDSSHTGNTDMEHRSPGRNGSGNVTPEDIIPMRPISIEGRKEDDVQDIRAEVDITTAFLKRNRSRASSRLPAPNDASSGAKVSKTRPQTRGLAYHFALLTLGFVALVLSSYVLSNAATNLVDQWDVSDVLFGVVILSIATTIPEKFVACLSGLKGHMGIMIANTVGSNIFLLTLCLGILWVSTDGNYDAGSVKPAEIGVLLGSSVAMTATVWYGEHWARVIGGVMLVCYIAFIILEFTVIHAVQ